MVAIHTSGAAAPPVSLRLNVAWTLTGNTAYAACQWLILVVLAKLGTPATVGQFSLALALTAPLFMLTNLQLRGIQATDARNEYSPGTYLGLRLAGCATALTVIAVVTTTRYSGREQLLTIAFVAGAKCVEAVSDVLFGLLQKHERMRWIALSLLAKGCVSVAAVYAGLRLTGSLPVACASLLVTWTVVLLVFDLPAGRRALRASQGGRFQPRFAPAEMARLTRAALPLGVAMLLVSLIANVPRYVIERELGVAALGVYSAIAYLLVAGTTVLTAVGQAATPRLARAFVAKDLPSFRRIIFFLTGLGLGIAIAGGLASLIIGRLTLSVLYGTEYARYSAVLTVSAFLAAGTFVASAFGYGLTACRVFAPQAAVFAVALSGCFLGAAILVPRFGLMGAAFAGGLSGAIQAMGLAVLLVTRVRSHFNKP
jgi:O-antigen/teichoic acid export membrane protein